MKNFLKENPITNFFKRYADNQNKDFDADFEQTFLKTTGKTFDQHFNEKVEDYRKDNKQ